MSKPIHFIAVVALLCPLVACASDDDSDTGESVHDASSADSGANDATSANDGAADTATQDSGDTGAELDDAELDDAGQDDTATADSGQTDADPGSGPTFDELHAGLFAVSCADLGCHYGVGLDFSVTEGLADRLLASASEADMPLITPGSLDASYLWHKVSGTHESAGGSGAQMPLNGSITESQFDLLENYIMITLAEP